MGRALGQNQSSKNNKAKPLLAAGRNPLLLILLSVLCVTVLLGVSLQLLEKKWVAKKISNRVQFKYSQQMRNQASVRKAQGSKKQLQRYSMPQGLPQNESTQLIGNANHGNSLVVAWQPSHQDDTGYRNWHEYKICGDIVDRAIKKAFRVKNIKCWDLKHGLTGSNNYNPKPTNIKAFASEVSIANIAGASAFISVHIDGGAPSGVLAEYLPGDAVGRELARRFVDELCKRTGLPNRGLREVRLYSLEKNRNEAKYRCLLEIGDNVRDRAFLENQSNRDRIAEALAYVMNGFSHSR